MYAKKKKQYFVILAQASKAHIPVFPNDVVRTMIGPALSLTIIKQ